MLKRGQVLFGWTFSILDVSGKEYQARVSNDLSASVICDEVHVPPAYASSVAPDPAASEPAADAPAPVVGAANVAGFALGGQVTGLDRDTAIDRDALGGHDLGQAATTA